MNKSLVQVLLFGLAVAGLSLAGCGQPQEQKSPPAATVAPAQPKAEPSGWTVIGPGGGGSQYEPTISPHDPDVVFVRCDMTGAYVTRDGGKKWKMFNLRSVVQDFEFDPGDPNIVYASNDALYRSEDLGRSWSLLYPDPSDITGETMSGDHAGQRFITASGMPSGRIEKVRVDPSDSHRIFLGLSGGRGSENCRVLVSIDRGKTWETLGEVAGRAVLALFPGAWSGRSDQVTVVTDRACVRLSQTGGQAEVLSLPVPDGVTAADGGKKAGGGIDCYVLARGETEEGRGGGGGRLYRSLDGGATWEKADSSLFEALPPESRPPSFSTLAVCESTPETVYLSCRGYTVMMEGQPQRQSGILKSTDGGRSWQWKLRVSGGSVISRNYGGGWLFRDLGWFGNPSNLGVSPTDPDICYGTDSGRTIKTIDGGGYWQQVISEEFPDGGSTTRGLDVTTCYGVHFDPYDPKHLFITYTDIGLFHSWDDGRTWESSYNGIPRQWRNTCYWLVFDPAVRGRIWSVWSNVHDLPRPKMHRSGNLVNGNAQGGVAVSGDGGRWWELCNVGVMENGEYVKGLPLSSVCTHITLDTTSPVEARTLYVCEYGKGVYKSADGGKTWALKVKGLGENRKAWRSLLLPDGRLILLVARGGIEGGGYEDGALYESSDGAEKWKKMDLPAGANAPNDLIYDPQDPNRLYLSCWPHSEKDGEKGGGLYRSEDGGKTWQRVMDEKMHVYATALDPADPATVYANTFDSAAFVSHDRGATWKRLGGYSFKWGHRPVPDPHHPGKLYLTTFGGSVFYGPSEGAPGAGDDIVNLPQDKMYIHSVLE